MKKICSLYNKISYFSGLQLRKNLSHTKYKMESQQFNNEACQQFVQKIFTESAIPSLMEYIKIPNLSRAFDPEWQSNGLLEKAAEHIKVWVQELKIKGLKTQVMKINDLSPIIFTQIEGDYDETIFFYGHYDKQPPFTGWQEGMGPTIPVIKDGKLYGRGGADDGYATYSTMIAIKALQQQGLPIPRCVMVTEGDQESGSYHIETYIKSLKQRIGNPTIFFCLDSGALDYERIWLTNSLRGMLAATVRVDVLTEGVHSGDTSGIVPSPFRILRQLISRIQDQLSGQMHQDFQVDIPPNRYKEMYDLVEAKGQESVKEFPFHGQTIRVDQNLLNSLIKRGWKAQMTVIGAGGLPECKSAGNVMLPYNEFRISIRLPPTKNQKDAEHALTKVLTKDPPYNAKVTLLNVVGAGGFNAPEYSQNLSSSLRDASNIFYGKQALGLSEGMSIPFLGLLRSLWPKGQFVVTGVLGPKSNAHGPNEFLHIDYCKRLTCSMAYVLAKTREGKTVKQTV